MADILPGPPVAQGKWETIGNGHRLIRMDDGNVLDWQYYDGSWRLWPYDPLNKKDVLPLPGVNSGTWQSIVDPHHLVKMIDGRVLDWDSKSGGWRLWNYDAKSAGDILPTLAASGQWKSIKSSVSGPPAVYQSHRLIPMIDGNVLDWGPREEGKWRLWTYAPGFAPDVLPTLVAQGQWQSILAGQPIKKPHRLIPMSDGRVLDWVPSDGSYRLWNYDPTNSSDIFPGDPAAQGKWTTDKWGMSDGPDHLVVMPDGRVLAWVNETGEWGLWEYGLPERWGGVGSPVFQLQRWFAAVDPMSRIISHSVYAQLTKPRPPWSRVQREVASLVQHLTVAERRILSEHFKGLKEYVDAIELMLGKR